MAPITPAQIRGARGMLGWSTMDLGRAARASVLTVKRAEDGGAGMVSLAVLGQVRDAIEAAGVKFLADDGDGPGVRLGPRQTSPFFRL